MGAFWSQIRSVLDRLGGLKESRILLLGLDAAGKTTILYKFQLNETICTIPTVGFNVERVEFPHGDFGIPISRLSLDNILSQRYILIYNDLCDTFNRFLKS